MQNGICEAFNGRMRDELLNETIFYDPDHPDRRWRDGPPHTIRSSPTTRVSPHFS